MAELPTGTVTFLFTDIEGSTKLLHAARGRRVRRGCSPSTAGCSATAFEGHGGVEVDTQGDAFFVAFARATDAVAAAPPRQRALADGRRSTCGWASTPASRSSTDEGYVGMDVHRAARASRRSGHGGQVLVSQTTRELVEDDLPDGVRAARSRRASAQGPRQAPAALPARGRRPRARLPAARDARKPADQPSAQPTPLDRPRARSWRRSSSAFVAPTSRLLTLTGPGGAGKTRLSLQAAAELLDDFGDGVFLVALAAICRPCARRSRPSRRRSGCRRSAAVRRWKRSKRFCTTGAAARPRQLRASARRGAADSASSLLEAPSVKRAPRRESRVRCGSRASSEYPVAGARRRRRCRPLQRARAGRQAGLPAQAATDRLSPRSAGGSTGCRSRSSWLPPARKVLSPRPFSSDSTQRLPCSPAAAGTSRTGSARCATRSPGATSSLTTAEQQLFRALAVFAGGFTLDGAEQVCDADLDVLQPRWSTRASPAQGERPLRDARDDPRVRSRAARGERGARADQTAARRVLPRACSSGRIRVRASCLFFTRAAGRRARQLSRSPAICRELTIRASSWDSPWLSRNSGNFGVI